MKIENTNIVKTNLKYFIFYLFILIPNIINIFIMFIN